MKNSSLSIWIKRLRSPFVLVIYQTDPENKAEAENNGKGRRSEVERRVSAGLFPKYLMWKENGMFPLTSLCSLMVCGS